MSAEQAMLDTSRKHRIFNKPEDQAFFEKNGYLIFDFLGPEEIENLEKLFHEIMAKDREVYDFASQMTYYISVLDKDVDMKRQVDQAIKEVFRDKIDAIYDHYRILYCNYMAKQPGAGEIQVHQDNTFVDEEIYTAFNLWVPLVDTNPYNGCFHLIPGSHKLLDSYRAGSVRNSLVQHNETIKTYMAPVPLRAGQGILFDQKLWHWSPNNKSDGWRPATVLVLIPEEADPVLAWYDEQNDPEHVALYKVDEDYLVENGLWTPPDGLELLCKKPYLPVPPIEELVARLDNHLPKAMAQA